MDYAGEGQTEGEAIVWKWAREIPHHPYQPLFHKLHVCHTNHKLHYSMSPIASWGSLFHTPHGAYRGMCFHGCLYLIDPFPIFSPWASYPLYAYAPVSSFLYAASGAVTLHVTVNTGCDDPFLIIVIVIVLHQNIPHRLFSVMLAFSCLLALMRFCLASLTWTFSTLHGLPSPTYPVSNTLA